MRILGRIIIGLLLVLGQLYGFSGLAEQKVISFDEDRVVVLELRNRLSQWVDYADELVQSDHDEITREEKLQLWDFWSSWLDIYSTLDTFGLIYDDYFKSIKKEQNKDESFVLSYHIFLTEYRYALELIERFEKDDRFDDILNDSVPELGLPQGTYADFKFRYLNVLRASEFAQLALIYATYITFTDDMELLQRYIDEDETVLLGYGKTDGVVYTLNNALDVVEDSALTAWYPIKKEILAFSSQIKVWRQESTLISLEQLEDIRVLLEPGDIVLEKREWQVSNVGIPGFWTHSALYIGTKKERELYFSLEDNVLIPDHEGSDTFAVIEALEPGVILNTAEESLKGDSLLVIRPKLSKAKKAKAIADAFRYLGRPYDYDFNFNTDSAIVCSELICKVYEPLLFETGKTFPRSDIAGLRLTSPNDIARYFSETVEMPQSLFEFVVFLDGNETLERSEYSTLEKAKESWKRPKWHVFLSE